MSTKKSSPSFFDNLVDAFVWLLRGIWRMITEIYLWLGRNFLRIIKFILILWGMVLATVLVSALSLWILSHAVSNIAETRISVQTLTLWNTIQKEFSLPWY